MFYDYLYEYSIIANQESLSDAALKLGLSLPTLSRHLKALEEELGTQLVRRSTAGISLTEDGRFVANAVRDMPLLMERLPVSRTQANCVPQRARLLVEGVAAPHLVQGTIERACELLSTSNCHISASPLDVQDYRDIAATLLDGDADIVLTFSTAAQRAHSQSQGSLVAAAVGTLDAIAYIDPHTCKVPAESRTPLSAQWLRGREFAKPTGDTATYGALWDEITDLCSNLGFTPRYRSFSAADEPLMPAIQKAGSCVVLYEGCPLGRYLKDAGWVARRINDMSLHVFAVTKADDQLVCRVAEQASKLYQQTASQQHM